MSSARGRVVSSWRFPEGALMKAITVWLYDAGLRGRALEREFARLIPYWKSFFDKPISDGAISQRADKARRYPNEAPENNALVRSYWGVAGRIVRRGARLGKREFRKIAANKK